jgi:hypothetical protein
VKDPSCDLCEEARITPWFHEDDLCWIAECEICAVPMVVWREHDNAPPDDVKAQLHERLGNVVRDHFTFDHYVDDNMRNIPDHYHAHARPVGGFFGHGYPSKQPPPEHLNKRPG